LLFLAIDYGSKRTGLAICDADETIATPLSVVEGRAHLVEKVVSLIDSEGIGAVVLGLPFNADGSEGPQAERVRRFGVRLAEKIEVPVYFQDERLSSFSAERKLADARLTRKKKAKRLDAVAAAEILQMFLEQKRG
jgi:putative Holliday junction resolvase